MNKKAPLIKPENSQPMPDFSHMPDLDLAIMQKECEKHPEDKQFKDAILIELGRRQKNK